MLSETKKANIIIAGEGGQGIQTIAEIFARACFESGIKTIYMPSFGVEQRGAPSVAYIAISDKNIRCPKFSVADFAIVLQSRAVAAVEKYIFKDTKIIFDSSTIDLKDLPENSKQLFAIPATQIAADQGMQKSFNLIILGALCQLFRLDKEIVWNSVLSKLGKKFKTKEIEAKNKAAFFAGTEYVLMQKDFPKAVFKSKHRSIFVKGHNKSGEISPARCKGCGICILKCPVGALSFGSDLGLLATPIPTVDLEKCIACGNCRNFCPDGAISIEKN